MTSAGFHTFLIDHSSTRVCCDQTGCLEICLLFPQLVHCVKTVKYSYVVYNKNRWKCKYDFLINFKKQEVYYWYLNWNVLGPGNMLVTMSKSCSILPGSQSTIHMTSFLSCTNKQFVHFAASTFEEVHCTVHKNYLLSFTIKNCSEEKILSNPSLILRQVDAKTEGEKTVVFGTLRQSTKRQQSLAKWSFLKPIRKNVR